MGAKYLPTVKDQKASQRFQQAQRRKLLPKPKAAAGNPPATPAKKK